MSPRKSKVKGKTEPSPLKNDKINQPIEISQINEDSKDSKVADKDLTKAVSELKISQPNESNDQKKTKPEGHQEKPQDGVPAKSKAELRAERRQIQEAQRAAKAAKQQQQQQPKQQNSQQKQQQPPKQQNSQQKQPQSQQNSAQKRPTVPGKPEQTKPGGPSQTETNSADSKDKKKKKKVDNVDHVMAQMFASQEIPMFRINDEKRYEILESEDIRQSVVSFGLKLGHKVVTDSWEIMKGLAVLLKEVVENFEATGKKCLVEEMIDELNSHVKYLTACRPFTVGMTNLVKHLKYHVKTFIDRKDLTEGEFKFALVQVMDSFYNENLSLAQSNISDEIYSSLREDEVIIVYGYSKLVLRCLYDAKKKGKNFKVIVFHHSSTAQFRLMAESIVAFGIDCELALTRHLTPGSELLAGATRVILSAEAAFIDGSVLTEAGGRTLLVAAGVAGVPVTFLCETFKFSDLNTMNLQSFNILEDTKDESLSVVYDVVPSRFVTGIVTEMGFRSPHSIEKILKKKWISTYVVY